MTIQAATSNLCQLYIHTSQLCQAINFAKAKLPLSNGYANAHSSGRASGLRKRPGWLGA